MSKKPQASINTLDARLLSSLVEGLSLEGLQSEILTLKKYFEFSTEAFKDFLNEKNTLLDYRLDKGKGILIDIKTKEQLHLSKKVEESFRTIAKDSMHWLLRLTKFTPKEILIILYFERL